MMIETHYTYNPDEVMEMIGIFMRNDDYDGVIMLWQLVDEEHALYKQDDQIAMLRCFLFAKRIFENKD